MVRICLNQEIGGSKCVPQQRRSWGILHCVRRLTISASRSVWHVFFTAEFTFHSFSFCLTAIHYSWSGLEMFPLWWWVLVSQQQPTTAVCYSISRFQMYTQLCHCWGRGGSGMSPVSVQDHEIVVVVLCKSLWICGEICEKFLTVRQQRSKVSVFRFQLFPQ